jgi:type II secretory pathway component GspD/PulD (secretin)
MRRLLPILLALLTLCGCAGMKEKIAPEGGPTFATARGQGFLSAEALPLLEDSGPIVRVIKGEPVEDVEAALGQLANRAKAPLSGLDATIDSLLLRNVHVRAIAELLTDICGYNVVATNTVAMQPVNIFLQNISLRESLNAICRLNNLWYREGQGIVTLMTHEEYVQDIQARQSDQTRAFYIRYTNAADMAKLIKASMGDEVHLAVIDDEKIYGHIDPEKAATISQTSAGEPTLSVKIDEGGDSLPTLLKDLVQGSGARTPQAGSKPTMAILTVFKRNNCIVARSLDGGLLNEMGRIIEALDTPTSQVLLEIKILQLTLGDGFESFFNINWDVASGTGISGAFASTLGLGGSTTMGSNTLNFAFNSEKLLARLALYENAGRAQIISTPFLMSANNSKVEFFVGEEVPLRDDVTTKTVALGDQGNTMTTFEVNIKREELGTDVQMTTFINADSTVTLEFEAEISTPLLNFSTIQVVNEKSGQVLDFPLDGKAKSELKSILSAKSGQTIAIGGIIRESLDYDTKKVPGLGDVPGLGLLFSEIKNTKKKTETVILLTPHVIMHPAQAQAVANEFLLRKSSHEQITKGAENILEPAPQPEEIGRP